MKIARVFPTRSAMSPTDGDCYFDQPGFLTPKYNEVHVSVVFTWDMARAEFLARAWRGHGAVKIGGPACGDPGDIFEPGKYVAPGVVFTSRGCPNRCQKCLVPEREGAIRTLPIVPGNIIQDNNLLACSGSHQVKVFQMLKGQRGIEFKGGLEACRITPWVVEQLAGLRIKSLFTACDTPGALPAVKKALRILRSRGFGRHKVYCYVIVGGNMAEEEDRMRAIWAAGATPFAQLYQPPTAERIEYPSEWQDFERAWCRPAIIYGQTKPPKPTGEGKLF